MIINNLKKATILAIILLTALITILYIKQIEIKSDLSSTKIAENFIYDFPKSNRIILSEDEKIIELLKENEEWKIKDNFYIDSSIINSIFKNISDNKFVMKSDNVLDGQKIDISIYENENKLYDFKIINNNNNTLLKPKNNNFYWLISKKINLPKINQSEFYKQPLYTSDIKEVKEISIYKDEKSLSFKRENFGDNFRINDIPLNKINSTIFAIFTNKINNIIYSNVVDIRSKEYLILKSKFSITLYNGIILNIKLFQQDNNHFVTIDAKLDRIHKNQAIKLEKEINNKYKNWLFQISSDDAKILDNQILLQESITNIGD